MEIFKEEWLNETEEKQKLVGERVKQLRRGPELTSFNTKISQCYQIKPILDAYVYSTANQNGKPATVQVECSVPPKPHSIDN